MSRLRLWIVALVVDIAFFFNLERLDFGQENVVDIQSFLYVLVTLLAVVVIAVPIIRKVSPAVMIGVGIVLYFLIGGFLTPEPRPIFGGVHTYLLITELAILSVTIILAYQVGHATQEFLRAVEQVTLPAYDRWVLPLDKAREEIKTELNRSRRYQRPLSVIVVQPESEAIEVVLERMVLEAQQTISNHAVIVSLGRMLKTRLRRTDLVMLEQRNQGRFIILCPETDDVGAADLIERVRVLADENLGFSVSCGTAFFPDDALTFDEVVNYAEARIRSGHERDMR